MAYQIFISYRRDGGEALACLISERLKQQGFKVFYDVDSLRSGKFNEAIFSVLDECKDVIVVLPPNGLNRCKNSDDWVRKEISYAIRKNKNVIPVMMRNFEFPEELPEDIEELRNFQGVSANIEYFDAVFEKLLSMLISKRFSSFENLINSTKDEALKQELILRMEELSKTNSPEAKFQLAYSLSKLEAPSINEEIAKLYSQAADMGYAPAQNNLGICYENGTGVEKNISKAFDFYKMSSEQGNSVAQYNLACCFSNDYEQLCFYWIKKAAAQNYPAAVYKLGNCYENGFGVSADYSKALEYYIKAFELGYEEAEEKTSDKYWKKKRVKDFFDSIRNQFFY